MKKLCSTNSILCFACFALISCRHEANIPDPPEKIVSEKEMRAVIQRNILADAYANDPINRVAHCQFLANILLGDNVSRRLYFQDVNVIYSVFTKLGWTLHFYNADESSVIEDLPIIGSINSVNVPRVAENSVKLRFKGKDAIYITTLYIISASSYASAPQFRLSSYNNSKLEPDLKEVYIEPQEFPR